MSQQQSQAGGRIPVQKILENHEVRLRKVEEMNQPQSTPQQSSQSQDVEVRREVEGMKRDMHEIARRVQVIQQVQQQQSKQPKDTNQDTNAINALTQKMMEYEKRIDSLEQFCQTLEAKMSQMNEFMIATNTDLLRFREQIFENADIKLHIQETMETTEQIVQTEEQEQVEVEEETTEQKTQEPDPQSQQSKRKEIDLDI